jgi:serine/threonine-protein kinase
VPVPSVSGLSQKAAVRAIKAAKLKVARVQSESSDTVPAGAATRTDPGAGVSLPVGSSLTLFVSSGKAKVPVPDVKGQKEGPARSALQAAGFKVQVSRQPAGGSPPGTVLDQSPAAGTQVLPGSTVNIVVAQAPPPPNNTASVPNVVGRPGDVATSTLTGAGFNVRAQTQDVGQKGQDNKVLSQNPAGGSTLNKGSTVTIIVGRFKPPKPNPPTTPTTPPPQTTTT